VVAPEVALQPLALVTVTLYEPDAVALMDCVVAPFDQRYEEPELAVSVTEPPVQNVVGPDGVIVADGSAFTVTVVAAEVALQPLALVTVTLYEPEAVTLIDCVVAPFDQSHDAPELAVSVTEPPVQNVVGPEGVIAAAGSGLTFTVFELVTEQPGFVTVTVSVTGCVPLGVNVTVGVFDDRSVPLVMVHA
jgi:hypothetical protein